MKIMTQPPTDNPKDRKSRSFFASLPERVVRAGAAALGGSVYQVTEVVLPSALRRTRVYQATVARMLRITVEMVGDVQGVMPEDKLPVRELAVRKGMGNAMEWIGILTVGWSPLWLLAAASDITGGTKLYLQTLSGELKQAGLLSPDAEASTFEELLSRLERTSGVLADTIDVPPVNVEHLRKSWDALRSNAADLPSAQSQAAIYQDLQKASQQGGHSMLEVSAIVAASALRAGIQLGNTHIFQYYTEALGAIINEGLLPYMQRITAPYTATMGDHFNPDRVTYTERAIRKVRSWMRN